jgi:NhaP-type Na+/H+ or K+/H+ antiporter
MDDLLLGLSLVVVLSIFARLLATAIGVPAIVPLLIAGVLAGTSVAGLVDPEALLGDSLSPVVQIAVGIILFEGALSLRREELAAGVRPAVVRLLTLGVLITWALSALSIYLLFDIPREIAVLVGAVIIVSGPTVVLPILDFIAPSAKVRSVLKWEGVLVDPIGAVIAVVVFASFANSGRRLGFDLVEILLSLGTGIAVGAAAAVLLLPILATRKLAGRDKIAATLMMVVAAFALSDAIFEDSGLLATIVMGVVLANQRQVDIDYIAEFKETLVPLLIGILFVLLAANVDLGAVVDLGLPGLALVAILVLIVRPLAAATTVGLPFTGSERTFFAAMAPRGIVAASTASAFGLQLTEDGVPGGELVIPITFLVIALTVLIYALGSPALARFLGLAGNRPPSLLLIGAPRWGLALGEALSREGAEVTVWTEDEGEAEAAGEAGLVSFGGPLDPQSRSSNAAFEELSAIAMVSRDDTLNQVLSWEFSSRMEADHVYMLRSPSDSAPIVPSEATPLFRSVDVAGDLEDRLDHGQEFRVLEPGEPVPDDGIAVASMRHVGGRSRPTIRLASDSGRPLEHSESRVVALAPPRP